MTSRVLGFMFDGVFASSASSTWNECNNKVACRCLSTRSHLFFPFPFHSFVFAILSFWLSFVSALFLCAARRPTLQFHMNFMSALIVQFEHEHTHMIQMRHSVDSSREADFCFIADNRKWLCFFLLFLRELLASVVIYPLKTIHLYRALSCGDVRNMLHWAAVLCRCCSTVYGNRRWMSLFCVCPNALASSNKE